MEERLSDRIKITFEFSAHLVKLLVDEKSNEASKFLLSLSNSSIFSNYQTYCINKELNKFLETNNIGMDISNEPMQFHFFIQYFCLFDQYMLEKLIDELMKASSSRAVIVPNVINHPSFIHDQNIGLKLKTIQEKIPLFLYNKKLCHDEQKVFVAYEATCALYYSSKRDLISIVDNVTTIVRFHKAGDSNLLKNALLSLLAQCNGTPKILLALQDVPIDQYTHILNLLDILPWPLEKKPTCLKFYSQDGRDIRAKMFNESFIKANSRYIAFLDYDDILFSDAYYTLAKRLRLTKKNATFGYVYASLFDEKQMIVKKRNKKYEKEFSYLDFLMFNHIPIHSIMFNKDLIPLELIVYHDYMKYFEDYYFTLQVFNKEETDWESLKSKKYIGDYMHLESSGNTLAFVSEDKKVKIKIDSLYLWCEKMTKELRYQLLKNQNDIFLQQIYQKNQKIVFFGASKAFEEAIANLRKIHIIPDYVCDNDPIKQGQLIHGYFIQIPDILLRRTGNYIVIITSSFHNEIASQVYKYPNVVNVYSYWHLDCLI